MEIQKDYVIDFIKNVFDNVGDVVSVDIDLKTSNRDDNILDMQTHSLYLEQDKNHPKG